MQRSRMAIGTSSVEVRSGTRDSSRKNSVVRDERLELGVVEDRMYAAVRRKLKTIRQGTDALRGGEGAEILVGELVTWAVGNGRLCIGLQLEENLLTDIEHALCTMPTGLLLEASLGSGELVRSS
jgi:hypothetical protein